MRHGLSVLSLLFAFSLLLAHPLMAAEMPAGVIAESCAGCHGTDGKSPGAIPKIHGLAPQKIAKAMHAFKSDERQGTVMNRIAKGYTDEEIDRLSQLFAPRKK